MYKKDRYIIICLNCKKEHKTSTKTTKYCSIACYNTHTKTKGIDGHRPCEICNKLMPYRLSVKVRANKNIVSIKTRFCSKKCCLYWRNILNNPAKDKNVAKKISLSKIGKSVSHLHTKEALLKRRNSIKGKKHWNWQGGKTSENKKRRNSYEIKQWRKTVFERDNYTCQICKKRNGEGKTVYLQADHIKPWCNFPELRLDINNGRTLCLECHRKTPTYGVNAKKMI